MREVERGIEERRGRKLARTEKSKPQDKGCASARNSRSPNIRARSYNKNFLFVLVQSTSKSASTRDLISVQITLYVDEEEEKKQHFVREKNKET